jgi:hypothetical protein
MQLRHISPRSSDWVDAMDEGLGGRGWEKLAPEEVIKLRAVEEQSTWSPSLRPAEVPERDYGRGDGSASR